MNQMEKLAYASTMAKYAAEEVVPIVTESPQDRIHTNWFGPADAHIAARVGGGTAGAVGGWAAGTHLPIKNKLIGGAIGGVLGTLGGAMIGMRAGEKLMPTASPETEPDLHYYDQMMAEKIMGTRTDDDPRMYSSLIAMPVGAVGGYLAGSHFGGGMKSRIAGSMLGQGAGLIANNVYLRKSRQNDMRFTDY